MKKFNKEDMLCIENGDSPNEYFEIVECGEWEQDHKLQYKDTIFKFGNGFYRLVSGRSGSPFTDWYYESEDWGSIVECNEVEEVEVVKRVWKTIN